MFLVSLLIPIRQAINHISFRLIRWPQKKIIKQRVKSFTISLATRAPKIPHFPQASIKTQTRRLILLFFQTLRPTGCGVFNAPPLSISLFLSFCRSPFPCSIYFSFFLSVLLLFSSDHFHSPPHPLNLRSQPSRSYFRHTKNAQWHSGPINFTLYLCIFIIMDFITTNNSSDKYKMSWRIGEKDKRFDVNVIVIVKSYRCVRITASEMQLSFFFASRRFRIGIPFVLFLSPGSFHWHCLSPTIVSLYRLYVCTLSIRLSFQRRTFLKLVFTTFLFSRTHIIHIIFTMCNKQLRNAKILHCNIVDSQIFMYSFHVEWGSYVRKSESSAFIWVHSMKYMCVPNVPKHYDELQTYILCDFHLRIHFHLSVFNVPAFPCSSFPFSFYFSPVTDSMSRSFS